MRQRRSEHESTSFQGGEAFDPHLDIKTDVAMVYGLSADLPERLRSWIDAGYIPHVMVGISWGNYQDYVRGEWDGQPHYDDAQAASGDFKLEHGISQGSDIFYMVPTEAYIRYLAEKLHAVVDAGAVALHLEEPEFWVRGGYAPSFKREWKEYYGEPWQDPLSSPDARYRASQLMQHLYTRAISTLCRELKDYARAKGVADFRCYVPTHSLLNYAHWRIVSPESQLISIPDCDGIIAQVWTGTARTGNVYQGLLKERTFETAYCEYASSAAMVRGTGKHLWLLADPIEDDPNHSWDDYRHNWHSTVTASLLLPEVSRFEVIPWPRRVFKQTYPKTNLLRDAALSEVVTEYTSRLDARGEHELARATEQTIALFERYCADQAGKYIETLGFAASPVVDQLRFGNVLTYLFGYYQHLVATQDPAAATHLRDAIAAFYHNPTEEREGIPATYATELQVVFNTLADMDWDDIIWDTPNPGIGLCISDTLMYQRGEPSPSDEHMSSVYGLALPLVKQGIPLQMVQLERISQPGYLDDIRVLLLSYDGMKPTAETVHHTLVDWVKSGGVLVFFGQGDAYNTARAWWNSGEHHFDAPQEHLLSLLSSEAVNQTAVGNGWLLTSPDNPTALAYAVDGAERVQGYVRQAVQLLNLPYESRPTLVLRRGPYVIAAGIAESGNGQASPLLGRYVNLFDATLPIVNDPIIHPDSYWLLYDLAALDEQAAWVIAASGRVDAEVATKTSLSFVVSGLQSTQASVRVFLPVPPHSVQVRSGEEAVTLFHEWHPASRTLFLSFPAQSRGNSISITFSS